MTPKRHSEIDWPLDSRNFCSTGFPADWQTKVRSCAKKKVLNLLIYVRPLKWLLYYLGRFYRMLFTVKFFSGITQSPEKSVIKFSLSEPSQKSWTLLLFFVFVYIPISIILLTSSNNQISEFRIPNIYN